MFEINIIVISVLNCIRLMMFLSHVTPLEFSNTLCSYSGCSYGLVWCPPTPSSTMRSRSHQTLSLPVESSSVTCPTCPSSCVWATVLCWWSPALCTPSKVEEFPRRSTRPSLLALPCTPPVSSGWPLYPSSLAQHSQQKRWKHFTFLFLIYVFYKDSVEIQLAWVERMKEMGEWHLK